MVSLFVCVSVCFGVFRCVSLCFVVFEMCNDSPQALFRPLSHVCSSAPKWLKAPSLVDNELWQRRVQPMKQAREEARGRQYRQHRRYLDGRRRHRSRDRTLSPLPRVPHLAPLSIPPNKASTLEFAFECVVVRDPATQELVRLYDPARLAAYFHGLSAETLWASPMEHLRAHRAYQESVRAIDAQYQAQVDREMQEALKEKMREEKKKTAMAEWDAFVSEMMRR